MHVLMYGSGRLSAGRAAKKLKRLADGGEIAMTGSFRGTAAAVPLFSLIEAEEWLAALHAPALFLHDDVSIEPSGLARLIEVSTASQLLTAPAVDQRSNAIDVGLIVGPSALLATFLADLRSERDASINVDHLEEVRIDHIGNCKKRPTRPLLVASMIVRDEAALLSDCLVSLEGLVDRVEVVDTGSADDTIAVAESHGAAVTSAVWTDDFSAARNVALERARDARYVLHIDADERAVVADIHGFRAALEQSGLRAIRVPMRNLADELVTSEFEAIRIFSADDTTWIGRVHEYPADQDGTPLTSVPLDGLRIDHVGYDPKIVANKDKLNRNVELAEAAYRHEPSFKTRLDLARSLAWRSDDVRAFAMFREAAADMTGASSQAAAFVLAHVAVADQIEGDLESAHHIADEAIGLCSGEFVAHLAKARAWRAEGDDRSIVDAHLARVQADLASPMFDTAASRHMTDNLTVGALARLGSHADATELAVSIIHEDPARFDEWKSLATAPAPMRQTALPLLASMDTTCGFVDSLVGDIPMIELSALVLANAEAQTPTSHAVITGIMAAVLSNDETTAARIAELGLDSIDTEQRAATADRCRLRGATTVAAILEGAPFAGEPLAKAPLA
jgi:hypothetical protein